MRIIDNKNLAEKFHADDKKRLQTIHKVSRKSKEMHAIELCSFFFIYVFLLLKTVQLLQKILGLGFR